MCLQSRGAVLGALSAASTTFSIPIELQESLKLSSRTANPYVKRSPELASYAEGLTNIRVPESLGVSEAASLFDVWMKDGAIPRGAYHIFGLQMVPPGLITPPTHTDSGDELFMSKYSEAGGNPRSFVWKGLLATMTL